MSLTLISKSWKELGCQIQGTQEQHDAMLEDIMSKNPELDKEDLSKEINDFLYW